LMKKRIGKKKKEKKSGKKKNGRIASLASNNHSFLF